MKSISRVIGLPPKCLLYILELAFPFDLKICLHLSDASRFVRTQPSPSHIYSLFANTFAYIVLLTSRECGCDRAVLNKIFLMYLLNNQPIMNAEPM
jgi:hypothetical protein